MKFKKLMIKSLKILVLSFESRLKQKEDLTTELEREASFFRGNYYYNQHSSLLYEEKAYSFKQNSSGITLWKSTGIDNYSVNTDLKSVANILTAYPTLLREERMGVTFSGNDMTQNKIVYDDFDLINIYIVYELGDNKVKNPLAIENGLLGALDITKKDVNTSQYQYFGYGICFDTNTDFTFGNIKNGKNVIMFGADMSFSIHTSNQVKGIYVLGRGEV